MNTRLKHWGFGLMALASSIFLGSCLNIFSPVDGPAGDAELLSAARAQLDQGNYAKAISYYEQLSNSDSDIKNSEEAITILDQNGATMGAFVGAFGTGGSDVGKGFTKLAGSVSYGSGQSKRVSLYGAYPQPGRISDTNLNNVIKFLVSVAFASELLAEDSSTQGIFTQDDLDSPVTQTCINGGVLNCAANCVPTGKKLVTGVSFGASLDNAASTDIDVAAPTLYMFNAALQSIQNALGSLGVNGGFANITQKLNPAALATQLSGAYSPCYRYALLQTGIGTN